MPEPIRPPDQHADDAIIGIENASTARDFLQKCKSCGLPIDDRLAAIEAQLQFLTSFLHNWFPDRVQQ